MRNLLIILPLLLFVPTPAQAFNMLQLMDPAFQQYVVIEIPLASMLAMGLADGLLLHAVFRPKEVRMTRLIRAMMRANLSALLLNVFLLALLVLFVTKTITTTEYQLPVLVGVGYFMLVFASVAWWRKSKAALALLQGASWKPKLLLAFTTVIGYGILYYIIYQRMFAYPG